LSEPPRALRAVLVWSAIAVVGLLTLPPLAEAPGTGIDPSWKVGLHLARAHGLTVGEDLFFTYGPWGFLVAPLTLTRGGWLAAVLFQLVIQAGLFALLGLWWRGLPQRRIAWLVPLPLLLLAPPPEYRVLIVLLLALRLVLGTRRERPIPATLLAVVAAAAAMVKFSMGLAALFMILGAAAAAWLGGRRRAALTLPGGFVAGVILWGLVALGSLPALGRFLAVSWEITRGYAASQVRGGPAWQPILVAAALLMLGTALLREGRGSLRSALPLALPACGLLVLVFKHAFVRQETHVFLAFSVGAALLTWIAVEAASGGEGRGSRLCATAALLIWAGALILQPPWSVLRLPGSAASRIAAGFRAERETRAEGHAERVRAELRERLPFPAALRELIGEEPADVMTVETSMIAAWELHWRPRPLLQGYAVGTAELDAMGAAFFAGAQAPTRLLVDLQGLDTRHPLMDAPRTWREILSRYEPLGRDSRWTLLVPRRQPRRAVMRSLGRVTVPLNEALELPRPDSGHLELNVELRPSLAGRLVSVPWKLPEIRVGLVGAELLPPRRILPATAGRPFPLTYPWAETPIGLGALFAGGPLPAPSGLAFFTGGSWAWQDAEVEIFEVRWLGDP
jgi:hypothetical protein